MVKRVNDKTLERHLKARQRLLLVSFAQIGERPELDFRPIASEIAATYRGQLDVVELGCDEDPAMAARLGVKHGPVLALYQEGIELIRLDGNEDPQPFFSFLDRVLNSV